MFSFSSIQPIQWDAWEFWVGTLIFSIFAYLMGSINTGHIISFVWKKDLGQHGSKNYGATNAGRLYGAKGFSIVFFSDMIKGVFVGIFLGSLDQWGPDFAGFFEYGSIPISLIFVVVGHMWPIYFKFKGGKGIATSFGVFLTLNWIITLVCTGIFFITLPFTIRISLSSSIAAICLIIFSFTIPWMSNTVSDLFFEYSTKSYDVIFVLCLGGILIIIRHIPNYINIIKGNDPGSESLRTIRNKILFKKNIEKER